jgi:hypothetical protein
VASSDSLVYETVRAQLQEAGHELSKPRINALIAAERERRAGSMSPEQVVASSEDLSYDVVCGQLTGHGHALAQADIDRLICAERQSRREAEVRPILAQEAIRAIQQASPGSGSKQVRTALRRDYGVDLGVKEVRDHMRGGQAVIRVGNIRDLSKYEDVIRGLIAEGHGGRGICAALLKNHATQCHHRVMQRYMEKLNAQETSPNPGGLAMSELLPHRDWFIRRMRSEHILYGHGESVQ